MLENKMQFCLLPMKILMVCLGNICRSPLAHGILEHKIKERGLNWVIDSAGTGDYHLGKAPDQRSIDEAARRGLDISLQRARQFEVSDFDEYDLILVMDAQNYQDVLSIARSQADKAKVELILNFAQPGQNAAVPDPYWDDNGFVAVYDMLDRATDALLKKYA